MGKVKEFHRNHNDILGDPLDDLTLYPGWLLERESMGKSSQRRVIFFFKVPGIPHKSEAGQQIPCGTCATCF